MNKFEAIRPRAMIFGQANKRAAKHDVVCDVAHDLEAPLWLQDGTEGSERR